MPSSHETLVKAKPLVLGGAIGESVIWLSFLHFPSPNPIGLRFPLHPPSVNQRARSARRDILLRAISPDPPYPGRTRTHLWFKIFPCIYNSDTPGTKIKFSRVDAAPHDEEASIPLATHHLETTLHQHENRDSS